MIRVLTNKLAYMLLVASVPLWAWSGFSASGYARGAAAYLEKPAGAYEAALGGAVTAWHDGLAGVDRNPALLDVATGLQLTGSYLFLKDDRRFITANGAMPVGDFLVFGVSFRRLSVGGIEQRDEYGNTFSGTDSIFEDRENTLSLAVAGRLPAKISAGLRARYLNQRFTDISDGSAHGMGFDVGAMWQPDSHVCVAVSGRNIGSYLFWATGHHDVILPQARCGVAGSLFDNRLILEADAVKTLRQPIEALLGVQYTLFEIISLRSGIATSLDIEDRHSRNPDISTGIGIRYSFFGCDYAITIPTEYTRDMLSHTISLVLRFNSGMVF